MTQSAYREGIVALGKTKAAFIRKELRVEVLRRGKQKSALKQNLARGGFQKIAVANKA